MEIKIITFGYHKNTPYKTFFETYEKRVKRYYKIELIELKEYPVKKSSEVITALKTEKKRVLEILKGDEMVYILSEHGKEFNTDQFKKELFKNIDISKNITFIIGSAHGIDKELLKKFKTLSLSKLTLPHLMARVILIEQIYRAVTIEKGIKYHK